MYNLGESLTDLLARLRNVRENVNEVIMPTVTRELDVAIRIAEEAAHFVAMEEQADEAAYLLMEKQDHNEG